MAWTALMAVGIIPALVALISLRQRAINEVAIVLWVIVVLVLPFIGPIAYFIVDPKKTPEDEGFSTELFSRPVHLQVSLRVDGLAPGQRQSRTQPGVDVLAPQPPVSVHLVSRGVATNTPGDRN